MHYRLSNKTRSEDALQDYSTEQDLQITLQDFKGEIGKEIHKEVSMLETRVDIKLEQMEQRIDDKAREYNSQILNEI